MLTTTLEYCASIDNGRTKETIFEHLKSEVTELSDEINADTPGEDGILGESVDIAICAIDQMYNELVAKGITDPKEQHAIISKITIAKLDKWKRIYG